MTIRSLSLGFFVSGLAALTASPPASAEEVCASRAKVLSRLAGDFREAPVAIGTANNGGVIEVMRSPDRATFTIVITMPDGIACMIAAGKDWQELPVLAQRSRR